MQKAMPEQALSHLRRELAPERLIPNLTAGLTVGLLSVALSISLAALIYSGELSGFLANGIGLALMSSVLVGITVALFSSLPGMFAHTQDAPAAILAVAAMSIVTAMPTGADPEALFMTVVATVALTTLAAAVLFIAVGSFKWGRVVRYFPYPVVGGFLAGTGWLLFTGGMGLMAGVQPSWSYLTDLLGADVWVRWLPGIIFAITILVMTRLVNHYLVWPSLIISVVILFFLTMLFTGASVNEWRAEGLLLGPFPDANLLQPVTYAHLGLVHWSLVASHAVSAATVIFVSLMSILFNATGLELATGRKIDLNQELRIAGLGNLLAGSVGGMIGYQGISFTTLNHKAGTGSRLGALIALGVVVVTLMFGASLLAFIPTMLVGGLLAYLGLSFLKAWIYDAYFKLPRLEYATILLILIVIATIGFLQGVGVGIVAAIILFVVNYSRAEIIRHALSGTHYQSRIKRDIKQRRYLEARGDKLLILQLQGFLFFGTVNTLLERVERRLDQSPPVAYVLLDFRWVTGLDATALVSFATLMQLAKQKSFTLIVTELMPTVAWQLDQNAIRPDQGENLEVFATLDEALEWCEAKALAAFEDGDKRHPSFQERLEALTGDELEFSQLLPYLERLEAAPGHHLIKQGEAPDALYIIASGQVTARFESEGQVPVRLETMRGGSVVGELGFYTGAVRTASVVADEESTFYRLSGRELGRMTRQKPELAATFHKLMVRLLADRVVHLMTVVKALQR